MQFDENLVLRSKLWNMPLRRYDNRILLFNSLIRDWLDEYRARGLLEDRKPRFLEIGVWKAETIIGVQSAFDNAFDYVGLDPYGQLSDDPYEGLFWKSDAESEAVYQHAKSVFDKHSGTLNRVCSDDFFKGSEENFDVVFVDGDHRFSGALRDMENGMAALRPGGLLIVDDAGNNFHPEVEWAVREFYNQHTTTFDQYGAHPLFFALDGMPIPVMLQFAVVRKV